MDDQKITTEAAPSAFENKSAPEAKSVTSARVAKTAKPVKALRVKTGRKTAELKTSELRTGERKPRGRKPASLTSPRRSTAGRPAAAARANSTATKIEKETRAMNFDATNWMSNLTNTAAFPGADKAQALFADVGSRGQQMIEKSQAVTGGMVELTRANVEALVETSKIAAAGVQTLGQDAVARTRDSLEQAAAQVKTLAEAASPTEFFQLQSEMARTQFDRMIADSSRFAESMVKLAGEAMQPISTRSALNAEKLNKITA